MKIVWFLSRDISRLSDSRSIAQIVEIGRSILTTKWNNFPRGLDSKHLHAYLTIAAWSFSEREIEENLYDSNNRCACMTVVNNFSLFRLENKE